MASVTDIKTIWDTLKEVDLAPLREEALRGVNITLVGEPESGRSALAARMRRDPDHPEMVTQTPVMLLDLNQASQVWSADLVVLLINAKKNDFKLERAAADSILASGKDVLVLVNRYSQANNDRSFSIWADWDTRRIVYADVDDAEALMASFVPVVAEMLPHKLLGLARHFPLFRVPIAVQLISDTCISNAAYSFSTGLAEMVPVLGIPLTVADIFVLTKMQAFMVYKLGLALGLSTHWQDYIAEFGGVLGSGFLWRQAARSLVGLIPVYGIIPKVAISYAGTYVIGQVILRWYLTGRHIDKAQMKALYREALGRGKALAKSFAVVRSRSKGKKQQRLLPRGKSQDLEKQKAEIVDN